MAKMSDFNKKVKEDIKNFGYDVEQFMFKSDFPTFDYLNGQLEYDSNGQAKFGIGIDAGKIIMIVGKAGCGKSTFGMQLAWSVMKKYSESTMFVYDFEQSHTKSRIKALTGMTDEEFEERIVLKKVGIYTESILKIVKQLAEFKKQNEKDLLVENQEGIIDPATGKLQKILPPTFIFIDSLASMRTRDYQDGEEMNGLTSGGRNAINNKELINRILQPCMEANIIPIIINHLNTNMSMGVTPPEATTRFLKNTEAVSGGAAVGYLTNLFLKIEAKEKLEPKDKYGIKGFMSNITVIKSRNSEGGRSFPFVFNQVEGFDSELSMFEFLKANGLVKGAGVGMYLEGMETVKFRMGNLKEKLATNPEFKEYFYMVTEEALKHTVSISNKISNQAANVSSTEDDNILSEDIE